jgi:uncharacterized protein (DUF488 family)
MATLHSIGHSTRSLDELIAALKAHKIETLVDIRAFPASRRLPHFNRELLESSLTEQGIGYHWMKSLGGYRKRIRLDSPNVALRNESFRNYADYALTPDFVQALDELLKLAHNTRISYMCAERDYHHCHRMIVSDWLTARRNDVFHIVDEQPAKPHELTQFARIVDGNVVYNNGRLF